jgi:hypothetical protein
VIVFSNIDNNSDNKDWDGIGDSQFDNQRTRRLDDSDDITEASISDNRKQFKNDSNRRSLSGSASLFSPPSIQVKESSRTRESVSSGFVVNEKEMELVSLFERTLPIQFVTLLALISFTIYIGFSGGITDGSDRYVDELFWNDADGTNVIVEPEVSDYLRQQQESIYETPQLGPSTYI